MPTRLKLLELQGYKTFANRTDFEFANTITAIVGPNGSGKSNIADSIRWVLGEQSYSLLRGKKTEDMIFSGSENRSRSGMATASITFDNGDGWLPIDFSEVAIARRAYRDGQNEYLINGQRVRLKDVSELLADSGLAERTYTIIGQGLVDSVLSLKAGERRRLFEEAAGIGLFRSRREEALRRLDSTQRNLERVQDILSELRPRLRSLERQAKRAGEFEQVNADLQVLFREYYGFHWNKAQNELSKSRQEATDKESSLDTYRREHHQIEQSIEAIRGEIQETRSELNNWQRSIAELNTEREATSRNLAVAEERARAISEARQNADVELTNRKEEMELYQKGVVDDDSEIQRLNEELKHAQRQVSEAQHALDTRKAEREQASLQIENLREEISSLNTRKGQHHARLVEGESAIDRINQNIHEAKEILANQQAILQKAQLNHEDAEHQVINAERTLEDAKKVYEKVNGEIKSLDEEAIDLRQNRDQAQAEEARLKAQLEVIEQAEVSMTGYASGTRMLLDAAKGEVLRGTQGVLINYLDVPPDLELAITSVLGEYLDAVVLNRDPDEALDYLIAKEKRGVLLPLEHIKPVEPISRLKLDNDPDVIGIAAELIHAPDDLHKIIDLFLGQVYIVRNRQAARRILTNQPIGVVAVTMRGEVLHASGPVQTSGVSESSGDQTLLGRARRRQELSKDLAQKAVELEGLDHKSDKLLQNRKEKLKELERCNNVLQEAEKAHLDAVTRTKQTKAAQEDTQRSVQWQQDKLQMLEGEVVGIEAKNKANISELEVLNQQYDQARVKLQEIDKQRAQFTLDDFQIQLAHWNTLAAVTERALTDANNRRDDRMASVQRLNSAVEKASERIDSLSQRQADLKEEQANWLRVEKQVSEEIQKLELVIDPAEKSLNETEFEQARLQTLELEARSNLSQAEHLYAQTRIDLARRQESLETWRMRIEDDLGLVAFDYADEVSGPNPLPFAGLVEELPVVKKLSPDLDQMIRRQRAQLKRIGPVNPDAQEEFREVSERVEFLTEQVKDLKNAEQDVRAVISELDHLMQREFLKTFDAVALEFRGIFTRLFGGGSARLMLIDPDDLTHTGIDIEAQLPGRRTQGLSLLSGGERSLTATALIFSLLKVSPTPFCVLDEVDAMLDEVNVGRFRELLRELSEQTQIVIVTHNRNTVQAADVIYGITMGRDSVSQTLSLKLDEVSQIVD